MIVLNTFIYDDEKIKHWESLYFSSHCTRWYGRWYITFRIGVRGGNEGGVGVISSAGLGLLYRNLSKDYIQASIMGLKEELRKAREKTKGVIGVNVMVAMSNFADMVKTAIAEKADIIFSGAGLPLNLPSFFTCGQSYCREVA